MKEWAVLLGLPCPEVPIHLSQVTMPIQEWDSV